MPATVPAAMRPDNYLAGKRMHALVAATVGLIAL
jgi:hypothetical protein